jgi:AcrR family transcriptional regulator
MSPDTDTHTNVGPEAATGGEVDGRTARRDRNRTAVLDAVLELFTEGDLDPAPDRVARRSGVSLRSVYRYLSNRDDLVRAAIERHLDRVGHLFSVPGPGEGPLEERVDRFVGARLLLYEAIAATARASRARAATNEIIRSQLESRRRVMQRQLDRHFAPELEARDARRRRSISAAADALTQIDTIDYLRQDRGLSNRQTRETLEDALTVLLGP